MVKECSCNLYYRIKFKLINICVILFCLHVNYCLIKLMLHVPLKWIQIGCAGGAFHIRRLNIPTIFNAFFFTVEMDFYNRKTQN